MLRFVMVRGVDLEGNLYYYTAVWGTVANERPVKQGNRMKIRRIMIFINLAWRKKY